MADPEERRILPSRLHDPIIVERQDGAILSGTKADLAYVCQDANSPVTSSEKNEACRSP